MFCAALIAQFVPESAFLRVGVTEGKKKPRTQANYLTTGRLQKNALLFFFPFPPLTQIPPRITTRVRIDAPVLIRHGLYSNGVSFARTSVYKQNVSPYTRNPPPQKKDQVTSDSFVR